MNVRECNFGSDFGKVSGEVNERARERVTLFMSKMVLDGVVE